MRFLRVIGFVVLAFVVALVVQPPPPVYAMSGGCAFANRAGGGGSPGSGGGYNGIFDAGDVITVTAALGTATIGFAQIESPLGTIVAGPTAVPGTLTYVIPAAGSYDLYYMNSTTSNGTVYMSSVCRPATVPSSGAVPTVPPPPKFFDPGDIRVDGQPGDRLAVYCPSDKQLQVIGIGANGKGAGVAVFNPADVIAAGKAGLSVPLKSYADPTVDLGRVTVQMIVNDGVTSIYIAWNGGILNASGQGDFKKMFVTPTRFCPFTFR